MIALWEASDRICGKRLKAMIPTLLPALERPERLKLDEHDRGLLLAISAATIDRLSSEARMVARGGRRRRAGFSSAVRREMPVRTFNDWNDPPPGFCEVDLVAHCGTSVTGAFLQTPMRVDIATGWTECFPLLVRERAGFKSPRSASVGLGQDLPGHDDGEAYSAASRIARCGS
ncbi:MAG: hypothetical protein M5U07_09490 [Xanthobacteraceae bacterium]|nr:hypothetical protein [Xanthobacteraceae bacterium]